MDTVCIESCSLESELLKDTCFKMDVLFLKYKTYCMENIKGDHLSDGTI